MATVIQKNDDLKASDKDPGIVASFLWIVGLIVFQLGGILAAGILQSVITGEPLMTMTEVDGKPVAVPNMSEVTMMFGIFLGAAALIAVRAKYLCRHIKPAWDGTMPHALGKKIIGISVLMVIGVGLLTSGYQLLLGEVPIQPELVLFLNAMNSGPAGILVVFLAGAVGAPVLEEILFRGQLQGAIQNKFGSNPKAPIYAIVITSAVFSLIHFQPLAIPPLFLAGVVFGWMRWKSGTLVLPILAHVLMNTASLTILLMTGEI